MTSRRVVFDTTALIKAADGLDAFQVTTALSEALNEQTKAFEVSTRKAMVEGIKLSESYVASKTKFEPSTAGRLRSSITVAGTLVVLGHYSPRVIYKPAKSKKARGDKSRGVPAGYKAAGVAVEVKRGQEVALKSQSAFVMKLRRGTDQGDTLGVFTREGRHRILHRYGVAPYSLFRHQAALREEGFMTDLQDDSLNRILRQFKVV